MCPGLTHPSLSLLQAHFSAALHGDERAGAERMLAYCKEHGIGVQSWGALGSPGFGMNPGKALLSSPKKNPYFSRPYFK